MDFKALFTDLKDSTEQFSKEEMEKGKVMGILSYIGILCLIPYFFEKDNKYVRYHAQQGLNLFLISLIYSAAYALLSLILIFIPIIGWLLVILLSFVSYIFPFISIWGIAYIIKNKAAEIPIVNKYKIVK